VSRAHTNARFCNDSWINVGRIDRPSQGARDFRRCDPRAKVARRRPGMNYDLLPVIGQLPANIAVLDFSGVIVEVNNGWRLFGKENGLKSANNCIGMNYMSACRYSDSSSTLTQELEDLIAGRRHLVMRWYPCHHPDQMKRWFILLGARDDESRKITVSHIDITAVLNAGVMAQLETGGTDARLHSRGM
jgi:hypothetical protein